MPIIIEGVDHLIEKLDEDVDALDAAMQSAMQQSVLYVEANVKALTPRRTGRLMSSIGSKVTGVGTVTGTVGTNVTYGPYQEYGTRDHGPVRAKVLAFPGADGMVFAKHVRGVRARRMFRDGLAASVEGIERLFKAAITEALE